MRRTLALACFACGLVGCTELLPPRTVDPYEYRIYVPATGGGSLVPLAFHWPRASLPITVYIGAESPLRPSLIGATEAWQDAFIYGEVSFRIVTDSALADIIVQDHPLAPGSTAYHLNAGADGCFGSTDYDANLDAGLLVLPLRISISSFAATDPAVLATCFRTTMLHELGHALGIFAHSTDPNDVMYQSPTRQDLSPRDRATITAVYHLPVTLTPTH